MAKLPTEGGNRLPYSLHLKPAILGWLKSQKPNGNRYVENLLLQKMSEDQHNTNTNN